MSDLVIEMLIESGILLIILGLGTLLIQAFPVVGVVATVIVLIGSTLFLSFRG